MKQEVDELPDTCCKVIGRDTSGLKFCDKPAKHWYDHEDDVCSYCDEHDYPCGTKISRE